MAVDLQEFRPVQPLRSHVQRFWAGRFDGRGGGLAQRVVPSGHIECIIHLTDHHCDLMGAGTPATGGWGQSPDVTLIGVHDAPYEVRFSDAVEVFAVRFRPAGFRSLFGVPLGELAGSHEDLEAVVGARFAEVAARVRDETTVGGRLRVVERFLEGLAADCEATYLDRAERQILATGGTLDVGALADGLGVSRRQLERAFREAHGVSPKRYMRVVRMNRAHAMLAGGAFRTLADVAYAAGYADQAHFTREFKALVGRPPSRYLAERADYAVSAGEPRERPPSHEAGGTA